MVKSASLTINDTVIEVGPGPGILTKALLESPAHKVYAIEIDKQFWTFLRSMETTYPDRFHLIERDALKIPLFNFHATGYIKIISNLPYNIGTALLINWLEELEHVDSLTLMLQKEVVDRICAAPNTKAYGRLSVLCQAQCDTRHLFDVPSSAFSPAPKVVSAVVQLLPKSTRLPLKEMRLLEKCTFALFQQRRKMLRSSLKNFQGNPVEDLLLQHGFNPTARPEDLSVEDIIRLSKIL